MKQSKPPAPPAMLAKGYACGGKAKKMADGGMMMACHNPDNKLPKHAMHVRGRNRGM